ncbi:hypothetical protein J4732_19715 [Serratia marcescens]|uniref:Uncharacterized protein n=1 Tax=Serratia marcescens TaxID=615 RepID=A0A939NQW4_SERMA|nr:hypothetical protein [Serratia marcescens]
MMQEEINLIPPGAGTNWPRRRRSATRWRRQARRQRGEHEQFFRTMLADIDEPSLPFGLSDVHGEGRDISTAHPPTARSTNSCGGRRGGWASARQPVPPGPGAGIGARYRPR